MPSMFRKPWTVIALLTVLNLLDYLDRYIIAAVGPSMQRDLQLTDGAFGMLGSAFLWGYVLTSPFFGRVAGRYPKNVLIALGIGVWSLATMAFGVVGSLIALLVIRLFIGVGMADFTALAPTIVDDIAEPDRKGRTLALFYSAVPVGSALGFIFGGLMDKFSTWHVAFVSAGAFGLLLAPLCLLIPNARKRSGALEPRRSFWSEVKDLRASQRYGWSVFGFAAQTFAIGGFAYWAPTFLERKFAYPAAEASLIFGAIVVLTGFIGTFLGGWIVDHMSGKDRIRNALMLSTVATLISVPFAFLAILASIPTVFFVSIAMVQLTVFATFSPINSVFLGSVPHAVRATAIGSSIFVGRLLGDMISIWLVGALSDAFHNLTWAMLALPAALVVNVVLWWAGISPPAVPLTKGDAVRTSG